MTRTHTDKMQLTSMFAYIQSYLDYNGKQGLLDENKVLEDIMCEKVQRYLEEQHKENSYITVLGLQKKLPIENAWMRLDIMTSEEIRKKQTETQWEFLRQYDEYSSRRNSSTYDVETLLVEQGNKVVLAGPGMGKSTLCKKFFCQAELMHIDGGRWNFAWFPCLFCQYISGDAGISGTGCCRV